MESKDTKPNSKAAYNSTIKDSNPANITAIPQTPNTNSPDKNKGSSDDIYSILNKDYESLSEIG